MLLINLPSLLFLRLLNILPNTALNFCLKFFNHIAAFPFVKKLSSLPNWPRKATKATNGANNNPRPTPKSLLRPPSVLGIKSFKPLRRESPSSLIPSAISWNNAFCSILFSSSLRSFFFCWSTRGFAMSLEFWIATFWVTSSRSVLVIKGSLAIVLLLS